MEEYYSSSFPMGKATRIMRRSIFIFLQNFQHLTSTPSLLVLPFSLSTLLSQSLIASPSSDVFLLVHARFKSLFVAAGFPPSSQLFPFLNLKLTQTLLSSLLVLPFTLSFLLLSKASVIRALFRHFEPNSFVSWISILKPLLITQFCNSLVIVSANAICFCLLIISFDVLGLTSRNAILLLSATGAVAYSIVLANACVVCSLSLIVSGVEKRGGFRMILRACVLIRGRTGTALSLAVPMNMALAGVEALFQYRILRTYDRWLSVLEAMLIAYMHAMLIVLDTVVGSVFLKSCTASYQIDRIENQETDQRRSSSEKEFPL
ncbi:hypothetical protein OROGR_029291 [Orobanche gracilis]